MLLEMLTTMAPYNDRRRRRLTLDGDTSVLSAMHQAGDPAASTRLLTRG